MTNKERRETKKLKLVRMMREAGVRYRASKPVIELLEAGADEIERLCRLEREMTDEERQKILDDLLNLLNMFRQKADDCDIEFKQTYDPAAGYEGYAYTEAAGELERLRNRIKK